MYVETPPPLELEEAVYCTWELYTIAPLEKDFYYLILPDACGDIIFDMLIKKGRGVFAMMSGLEADELNLGKEFHYQGIRFLPGAISNKQLHGAIEQPIVQETRQQLTQRNPSESVLYTCIRQLIVQGFVVKNPLMYRILTYNEDMHTVGQLEALTGYSTRQLQRIFRKQMGYSPHDFLKILRFQNTLTHKQHYYADQSHYIREFKRITGMTPRVFEGEY